LLRLLVDLKKAGTQRLGLTGGEPLVRKDIDRVVAMARELGFFLSLNTNGDLVPDKKATVGKCNLVTVSLDGPPEMHDANRQSGSHQKALQAMDIITQELGVPLWTTTTLTRHNLHVVDYMVDLAQRKGFRCVFQLLHHPEPSSGNPVELYPVQEEYRRVIEKIMSCKRTGAPIVNSMHHLRFLLEWDDYAVPVAPKNRGRHLGVKKCFAGIFYSHIDINGDVYSCHQLLKEVPVRNFREVGFEDAFDKCTQGLPCDICIAGDYLEYNLLFNLKFEPLVNLFRAAFLR
jgi:MoaA/NifB/PqqE/SkfB family radical SAM enzyme